MTDTNIPGMLLPELLAEVATRDPVPAIEVSHIASNSAAVSPGAAFVALAGSNVHGIDYAIDAVKAGATVVLYDANDEYPRRRVPLLRKQVRAQWIGVDDLQRVNGPIVSRFFGDPGLAMTIVGVTGTDGKSSVTHLLTQALTRIGRRCASIGTLGHGVGNRLTPASLTTPDAVSLQARLHEFRQKRCEFVVMEVSSHALEQYRVDGCHFNIAVLTNLGRDHLDYHGNVDNYARAKARLFRDFDLGGRVVNADDDFGRQLIAEFAGEGLLRYSLADGDAEVRLESFEHTPFGQNLVAATPLGEIAAVTALLGRFNLHNTLACIATLVALGLDRDALELAVKDLHPIPGRMEMFQGGAERAAAVVDFAHTEQALRACLTACREHTRGKLWCVFGCGGDRDPGKRPGMGAAAEELADRLVVTDDNPRGEPPQQIVADILAGMRRPERASVVHDREAAIEYALGEAAAGDLVVVAGKGHESEQIVGGVRRPFSDRHVVARVLGISRD